MNPLLLRRISATLIDTCLYLLLIGLGYSPFFLLPIGSEIFTTPAGHTALLLWPVLLLSLLEVRSGQSSGKRANSLALSSSKHNHEQEDQTPGFVRVLLRNLIKFPTLGLGIASIIYLMLSLMTTTEAFWITASIAYGLTLILANAGIFKSSEAQPGKSLYDLLSFTQLSNLGDTRPLSRWLAWPAVAAISLILFLIALPNYLGACACGSVSSVRANMHTMQTIVETYAVDWGGKYPPNLETLQAAASDPKLEYWREIRNPYPLKIKEKTLFWEHEVSREDLPGAGYAFFNEGQKIVPGAVSYAVSADQTRYWIYGYTDKEKRIENKGAVFFLTNS